MAEGIKRKMSAILKADAVGYSRLMGADEATTIDRVTSYRELIESRIIEHNGRMVDSPGDEILAEFPAALDASRCAVEIQQALKNRNIDLPEDRRMEFRIGIHTGDVMAEGDRVYGDTVNIAARLEELAEPSGICVSGAIYDQIRSKLNLGFVRMGEKKVKNISKPVPVYRVQQASKSISSSILRLTAYAAALILCLISATTWHFFLKDKIPSEPPFSEKPSIAVLPFDNMSGDPEQEYFSDGISNDIINGLARNPNLDVIARTSSFQFGEQSEDIRDIGEQLNVKHVVEGSVRKAGNRIRVTAQLINTDRGTNLWSEQYDRELTDIFETQDEIVNAILGELSIHLVGSDAEQRRPANVEAYDAYLLGIHHWNHVVLDKALESFEHAVSLDPDFADAYGALAGIYSIYLGRDNHLASEYLPIVRGYIAKALSLNPNEIHALIEQARIRFFIDREYQEAINQTASLVQKYPNDTRLLRGYCLFLQTIGHFDLGFRASDRLIEIDPQNPRSHGTRASLCLRAERFEEARRSFKRVEMLGVSEPSFIAELFLIEGQARELQELLDRGQSNWLISGNLYPFYEAAALRLQGEYRASEVKLAALKENPASLSYHMKNWIALIEGDFDRSLDYYAKSVTNAYFSLSNIQAPPLYSGLFPEYRSHPEYQKMLKDMGLDGESVAKLVIPPLPF